MEQLTQGEVNTSVAYLIQQDTFSLIYCRPHVVGSMDIPAGYVYLDLVYAYSCRFSLIQQTPHYVGSMITLQEILAVNEKKKPDSGINLLFKQFFFLFVYDVSYHGGEWLILFRDNFCKDFLQFFSLLALTCYKKTESNIMPYIFDYFKSLVKNKFMLQVCNVGV